MKIIRKKHQNPLDKELASVERAELRMAEAARKAKPSIIKTQLEAKVPYKIYLGLQSAFGKGFTIVFDRGRKLIEKSYNRDRIKAEHAVRDYAVDIKGRRKEIKDIHKNAGKSSFINLSITSIEGIALGALGIGMPDIVIFLSMLLKGVYETALNYGFDYSSRHEQYIILKMLETSLAQGEDWQRLNDELDGMFFSENSTVSEDAFARQLRSTSSAFAADMLLLKFVQSVPVVGVIGGAANPIYYKKVMKYVSLKYKKYYLIKKQHRVNKSR